MPVEGVSHFKRLASVTGECSAVFENINWTELYFFFFIWRSHC